MSCRAIQPSCVPLPRLLLERTKLERLLNLQKMCNSGRSSEKLDADQLHLVLEDIDGAVQALEAAEDRADHKTRERRAPERRVNRGKLPESICHASSKSCSRPKPVARAARVSFFEIGSDEDQTRRRAARIV